MYIIICNYEVKQEHLAIKASINQLVLSFPKGGTSMRADHEHLPPIRNVNFLHDLIYDKGILLYHILDPQ